MFSNYSVRAGCWAGWGDIHCRSAARVAQVNYWLNQPHSRGSELTTKRISFDIFSQNWEQGLEEGTRGRRTGSGWEGDSGWGGGGWSLEGSAGKVTYSGSKPPPSGEEDRRRRD